jgi:tRNA 2-thiouridine synthesizing protein D
MSSFAIVIRGAPHTSQAALSALKFAQAVLASGHTIQRLFFYEDGVLNASALLLSPQDELHLPAAWQELINQHGIDAVVCVASAHKRGVLDDAEAQRLGKPQGNVLPGFCIGGLGQLVDAAAAADRVVNFAP